MGVDGDGATCWPFPAGGTQNQLINKRTNIEANTGLKEQVSYSPPSVAAAIYDCGAFFTSGACSAARNAGYGPGGGCYWVDGDGATCWPFPAGGTQNQLINKRTNIEANT